MDDCSSQELFEDDFISWKGTKLGKVIYSGESSAFVRVAVFNDDPRVNTYTDEYTGFIGFSKKFCGMDALRKKLLIYDLISNRVTKGARDERRARLHKRG